MGRVQVTKVIEPAGNEKGPGTGSRSDVLGKLEEEEDAREKEAQAVVTKVQALLGPNIYTT